MLLHFFQTPQCNMNQLTLHINTTGLHILKKLILAKKKKTMDLNTLTKMNVQRLKTLLMICTAFLTTFVTLVRAFHV